MTDIDIPGGLARVYAALIQVDGRVAVVGDRATSEFVFGAIAGHVAGLYLDKVNKDMIWLSNGSTVIWFSSSDTSNRLRGPVFHLSWVFERAGSPVPDETMTNLQLATKMGNAEMIRTLV